MTWENGVVFWRSTPAFRDRWSNVDIARHVKMMSPGLIVDPFSSMNSLLRAAVADSGCLHGANRLSTLYSPENFFFVPVTHWRTSSLTGSVEIMQLIRRNGPLKQILQFHFPALRLPCADMHNTSSDPCLPETRFLFCGPSTFTFPGGG